MNAVSRITSKKGDPPSKIARPFPGQGPWTEFEYLALEANGSQLIELNDGVLAVLPMPDAFHQDLVAFLYDQLKAWVVANEVGKVYFAPMPIRLWESQLREPDVAFLKKHRIKSKRTPPEGADLVIEVVSPGADNRRRDLKEKRRVYAQAGIAEYWIVDPEEKSITVLTLEAGKYKSHGKFKPGKQARSKLLEGFSVSVADVFAAGEAE